jgi:hypothetical protein
MTDDSTGQPGYEKAQRSSDRPTDVEDRLDRLESTVKKQQATIEAQRNRIADLASSTDDAGEQGSRSAALNRRTALKAGGLLALLFGGVGTASADAQGQVGTADDPLEALYTEELNGGVTGDDEALTDLTGPGLTIADGVLAVSAISPTELVNDSVTVAGNTVSLGGSTGVAHSDLSGIGTDNHHTRPSAGAGLTENSDAFEVGLNRVGSGTGVLDGVTSDNIEHRSLSGANGVAVSENGGTVTVGAGQTGVVTDTATSFTESGVTVNTTRASVSDSAVRASGNTSTASRPGDTNTFGDTSDSYGVKIEPNVSLVGLVATISSNTSGASTVKLTDSQLNTIQSKPFPGSGNTVNFDVLLSSGDKYYLLVDGSGYNPGYLNTASYPYPSQYVDIITGRDANFDNPSAANCISKVEAIATSEATVEFGDPTPVSRWETVTFQSRAGGGSVDVAVEVDDGGWSFWDYVGSGTDLSSIPPDQNVRLRAEFTAGSVSDDPRLTFANRQYRP